MHWNLEGATVAQIPDMREAGRKIHVLEPMLEAHLDA